MFSSDFRILTSVQLRILAIAICVLAFVSTSSAQTETVLHNFIGTTGAYPDAGLIADGAGNLYGTATVGGISSNFGVVYKLDASGHYTVLHEFGGGADGITPTSRVTRDGAGNLYGTAELGGTSNCGMVYKLDPGGQETVLYSFTCKPDGKTPAAELTFDVAGNLYGTTVDGGAFGQGAVYRLDANGRETVLHSFGGPDGQTPVSDVTLDAAGNLYGTTEYGGVRGRGAVYKLDTSGGETVLYSFSGGRDGGAPYGGLIRDASGSLYGTASIGGAGGKGVVFKIDPEAGFIVLHNFAGSPTDGAIPLVKMTTDSSGNLYGTTLRGGAFNNGVIFKIDALTHQEALIYSFNGVDGSSPNGPLLIVGGNIYGTTYAGGAANYGVLFKLTPAQ